MTLSPTPGAPQAHIGSARSAVLLATVAALLALVSLASAASAQPAAPADPQADPDALTWSVRPADTEHGVDRPNFGYEVEAGEEITDGIVITNMSAVELTLDVYAADGYTTPSGQLDLIAADQPSVDLGAWVDVEEEQVTLAAGESAEVAFTLSVPQDAAVGDHPGGIVAAYSSETAQGNVRQDSRLGSRMHVRVAGEFNVNLEVSDVRLDYSASWNPLSGSPAVVSYTLTNPGNVRTFAHEEVTFAGPGGMGATSIRAITDEVLPGDSIQRQVELDGVLPMMRLTAAVEVTPEAVGGLPGTPIEGSASVTAIPWTLLAILTVLILVVSIVLLRRRRAKNGSRAALLPMWRRLALAEPGQPFTRVVALHHHAIDVTGTGVCRRLLTQQVE